MQTSTFQQSATARLSRCQTFAVGRACDICIKKTVPFWSVSNIPVIGRLSKSSPALARVERVLYTDWVTSFDKLELPAILPEIPVHFWRSSGLVVPGMKQFLHRDSRKFALYTSPGGSKHFCAPSECSVSKSLTRNNHYALWLSDASWLCQHKYRGLALDAVLSSYTLSSCREHWVLT